MDFLDSVPTAGIAPGTQSSRHSCAQPHIMQLIAIYFPNFNHPKHLMKPSIPLSLLAAALLTTAPASAFELDHSEGALSLNTTPEKLVSFDVGVLDSLAAL